MALNIENQTDPVDCKLRPVSSIEAISELDPGQFTGPLSSIFRNIIDLLSGDYNYDTTNLAAVPVGLLTESLVVLTPKRISMTGDSLPTCLRSVTDTSVC